MMETVLLITGPVLIGLGVVVMAVTTPAGIELRGDPNWAQALATGLWVVGVLAWFAGGVIAL